MSATKRPVHPIADLFPMMTDEELANLAADIKANGLIHPIVVDKDGVLIDGRNRDRACEIAGIEPLTVLFEGDDPRAYIIANNISRRHLTKGQQAMAVAMIYPVPEKGGRGKKKTMDETSTLFSPKRLQLARTVLAHSSDLAQAVLAGSKFLDAAYDEARKAKQLLDAQVAGNVRRKVARSKKVAVLRGIVGTSHEIDALAKLPAAEQHSLAEAAKRGEKVSAITARNVCDRDSKDPKMSDENEEIELGKAIARLRRAQPHNADTMLICDALERRLKCGSFGS
jgi:ParB-like chromosome segregation protein Spo0J